MHGFGPVPLGEEDYVFRHDWQRRSFALAQALAGPTPFCADMHRHKIEQLPAIDYLRMDYFEKWAHATSELLKDAGLASAEELATGAKRHDVDLDRHAPSSPEGLIEALAAGVTMDFPASTRPSPFTRGQSIRVSTNSATGHTRVPRYVRGKAGTVIAENGVFQFADSVAMGAGPDPQHCYTVVFEAFDLWGEVSGDCKDKVYVDLAEAYLEHV
nr:nitrile hydratase subunit beta [Aminobacter sp. SS-2016]